MGQYSIAWCGGAEDERRGGGRSSDLTRRRRRLLDKLGAKDPVPERGRDSESHVGLLREAAKRGSVSWARREAKAAGWGADLVVVLHVVGFLHGEMNAGELRT